ncbi:MAG: glycosyltransferase [Candidatus Methylomirabilia bacterium]
MRIAQGAPLYERVPPVLYGGTERIVSYVTEELVRRGHLVMLFATGDSKSGATLTGVAPHALRLKASHPEPWAYYVLEPAGVFQRAAEFDIIHCHLPRCVSLQLSGWRRAGWPCR